MILGTIFNSKIGDNNYFRTSRIVFSIICLVFIHCVCQLVVSFGQFKMVDFYTTCVSPV